MRLNREDISVTTDGTGAAAVSSAKMVNGEILAIAYLKGTVNAATTAVITTTNAPSQSLDSYDVNSGNATRYIRAAVNGAAAGDNKWCPFVAGDTIKVTVAGGAASKAFTVQVYWR